MKHSDEYSTSLDEVCRVFHELTVRGCLYCTELELRPTKLVERILEMYSIISDFGYIAIGVGKGLGSFEINGVSEDFYIEQLTLERSHRMANYYGKCRTNYFAVTDVEKFADIMRHLSGEGEIAFNEHELDKGKYMFYCKCNLTGYIADPADDSCDETHGKMIEELQKILPDGEAIILTEVGYETIRYIVGVTTIITNSEVRYANLADIALATAREMLKNPGFTTELDY